MRAERKRHGVSHNGDQPPGRLSHDRPRAQGARDGAGAAAGAATAEYCYLTTTGRVSGRPHEIEIWFALVGATVYLLSEGGEQADWVKNLRRMPAVTVRLGDVTYPGVARALDPSEPADALARRLICGKYEGWREGDPLPAWARTALPVAVELRAPEGNRRPESSD